MATFKSAYPDAQNTRPGPVLRMEQSVTSARTHEEAQTQLLYELAVGQFKLYRLVQYVIVAWAALVAIGVIIVLASS